MALVFFLVTLREDASKSQARNSEALDTIRTGIANVNANMGVYRRPAIIPFTHQLN